MPANRRPRVPATRTHQPRPAPDHIVGWHVFGAGPASGYYAWDGFRYRLICGAFALPPDMVSRPLSSAAMAREPDAAIIGRGPARAVRYGKEKLIDG